MSADRGASKGASSVSIRQLAASDVPTVLAILQESPEAAAWSQESLLQLGSVAPTAWVVERDGVVAGFLIGRSAADEFEILNMAVSGAHRRQGIGSKLLESALEVSRKAGTARVYLEVRASNEPAIALYKRHGFRECGRRIRYYRDPVEDAILLSLSLV
jgi:ribosomal-protein-alanine N-acetyltransferase